jgi:hypothetical protein
MKICHCVKISDEEMKSLLTARDMIRQVADDDMLAHDFDDGHGVQMGDIAAWLDDVFDFFEAWR